MTMAAQIVAYSEIIDAGGMRSWLMRNNSNTGV